MNDSTTDAATIFAPLWRRKWVILAVGLLVAALTYVYYKRQPAVYLAKTQLYLTGSSEQPAADAGQTKSTLSTRALADQVELINSRVIGLTVRRRLRAEHEGQVARGKAKATVSPTSDFITIATEAHTPKAAITLANTYAEVYLARQHANLQRSLMVSISNARQQLRRIEPLPSSGATGKGAKGPTSSSATLQAATLASKINQLESQLSGPSGSQQVSPATANPVPIEPTPKKNGIFGGILGLLLAAVAVYVLSRFNRRMGSLEQVEGAFRAQILTALPKVRNPIIRRDGVSVPSRPLVEPLRRLHTTLQLAGTREGSAAGAPRTLLFLSAESGDGKSTTIANLARVQRDAGERVVVVEADFRRPVQARLLETAEGGLADVLTGAATLDRAMHAVDRGGSGAAIDSGPGGPVAVTEPQGSGSLSVLPSGCVVDNPPALLAGPAMRTLLRSLAEEHDYVLIDAPSLLEVSDAMPLLTQVDGIIIVARIGHTRGVSAERLVYALGRTASAPVLGVVANCVSRKDAEQYGFSFLPPVPRSRSKLVRG